MSRIRLEVLQRMSRNRHGVVEKKKKGAAKPKHKIIYMDVKNIFYCEWAVNREFNFYQYLK